MLRNLRKCRIRLSIEVQNELLIIYSKAVDENLYRKQTANNIMFVCMFFSNSTEHCSKEVR